MTMSNGEMRLYPAIPKSPEFATEAHCKTNAAKILSLDQAKDKPKEVKSVIPFCVNISQEDFEKGLLPKV